MTRKVRVAVGGAVRRGRDYVVALLTSVLLSPVFVAAAASSGERVVRFDIPRQPADSALIEYAEQADITFIFPADEARKVRANEVRGEYTVEAAIHKLLEGTGLQPRFQSGGGLTVGSYTSSASRGGNVKKLGLIANIVAALAGSAALDVNAQENAQETAAAPAALEEVIVTAQKREERLHDVPLSVSALTGTEIDAMDLNNLQDMQYSVPGLSINKFGPGQRNIQIRGVSGILGRPTTGEYLNELSIGGDLANQSIRLNLLDMERIEVLRGPQGTLYGEGSMGGSIRYITAPPDLSRFSASSEAEGGHITGGGEEYKIDGVVNVPFITDKLGLRLVAGYEDNGGWIDNSATGESNVNGTVTETYRGELLARPTDKSRISVLALHQSSDQDRGNFGIDGTSTATVPTSDNDRYDLVNATVHVEFESVELVDSIGYIDHRSNAQFDFTPLFLPILESVGVPPGSITEVADAEALQTRTLTNELRLASRGEQRTNWMLGGVVRSSELKQNTTVSTSPGTVPFEILSLDAIQKSDSYSLFGELSFEVTSRLRALVGVRYYYDREQLTGSSVSFGDPVQSDDSASFDSVNPRFNLRYTFSPASMVYFNAAEGFRSGGFNVAATTVGGVPTPPTYDPDTIRSYEIGTKQQLFDRTLELEGAVYYSDWTDVQSTYLPPGAAQAFTANAGQVSGWGVDFSARAQLAEPLTLSVTYGWNNLQFRSDTASKLDGDPVDYSPHDSYSVSLDYRQQMFGETIGFVRADYQHNGKGQVSLRDFGQIVELPARDTANLRGGLDFGNFEISIYARNAFNDDAPVQVGPYAAIQENVEQQPRTVGINVSARL